MPKTTGRVWGGSTFWPLKASSQHLDKLHDFTASDHDLYSSTIVSSQRVDPHTETDLMPLEAAYCYLNSAAGGGNALGLAPRPPSSSPTSR